MRGATRVSPSTLARFREVRAGESAGGCAMSARRFTTPGVAARHVARPGARLVPMLSGAELEVEILAGLRGSVKMRVSEAELLRPTGDEAGWVLEPGGVE